MAYETEQEIKYAALKELGVDAEPDFMDSSIAETDKVNERYEPCLIYALTRYIWSFAKQEVELTAREALTGQRFKYRYALPEDLLYLRGQYSDAQQSSSILDFEKRGNYIFTNSEEVFIAYTRRVAESELPVYFTDFFILSLARDICLNLTGDDDLEQTLLSKEHIKFIEAKNIDCRQNPPKRFRHSPYTDVRH